MYVIAALLSIFYAVAVAVAYLLFCVLAAAFYLVLLTCLGIRALYRRRSSRNNPEP